MRSPHLLNLRNVRKVKSNLSLLLDSVALDRIEAEICANSQALLKLAQAHYDFARRQAGRNWRQKVSRLYYAGYNASRAVRLYVSGDYSMEAGDHKKVGDLPEDFPNRSRYKNHLEVLREDRNSCDYDHVCSARDLVLGSQGSLELVRDFLNDVKAYLKGRGLTV